MQTYLLRHIARAGVLRPVEGNGSVSGRHGEARRRWAGREIQVIRSPYLHQLVPFIYILLNHSILLKFNKVKQQNLGRCRVLVGLSARLGVLGSLRRRVCVATEAGRKPKGPGKTDERMGRGE